MTSLAEVLAFKFPGVQGIRTRETASGDMEIFDWNPAVTGAPLPTTGDIARWRGELAALGLVLPEIELADLYQMLVDKGTLSDADLPSDRRPPQRP